MKGLENHYFVRNQIRFYREKFRISQGELADYLGKSKSFISKIEKGEEKIPSLTLAFLIVEAIKQIYQERTGLLFELRLEDVFQIEKKGEC